MYSKILIATDGSASAELALDTAVRLAQEQHSKLQIIHVVDTTLAYAGLEYETYWPDIEKEIRQTGQRILNKAGEKAALGRVDYETRLLEVSDGRVAAKILEEAERWAADLLIIGAHGRGFIDRLLLGSVSDKIIRKGSLPILLIKDKAKNN